MESLDKHIQQILSFSSVWNIAHSDISDTFSQRYENVSHSDSSMWISFGQHYLSRLHRIVCRRRGVSHTILNSSVHIIYTIGCGICARYCTCTLQYSNEEPNNQFTVVLHSPLGASIQFLLPCSYTVHSATTKLINYCCQVLFVSAIARSNLQVIRVFVFSAKNEQVLY